jgi:hypothetical protein
VNCVTPPNVPRSLKGISSIAAPGDVLGWDIFVTANRSIATDAAEAWLAESDTMEREHCVRQVCAQKIANRDVRSTVSLRDLSCRLSYSLYSHGEAAGSQFVRRTRQTIHQPEHDIELRSIRNGGRDEVDVN